MPIVKRSQSGKLYFLKLKKKYYVDLTVKKSKEPVEKSNRAGIAGNCSCLTELYYIGDNWIHNSDFASHMNKFLLSINKQTKLNQLHILSMWRWCIDIAAHPSLLLPCWYGHKEIHNIRRLWVGRGLGTILHWWRRTMPINILWTYLC